MTKAMIKSRCKSFHVAWFTMAVRTKATIKQSNNLKDSIMATSATRKANRMAIDKEALRRYLSENNRIQQVIKNIEKLEDLKTAMEQGEITRLNSAINARLALLKKYLPDEKSIEIKNADGESFKTESTVFNFVPVGRDD